MINGFLKNHISSQMEGHSFKHKRGNKYFRRFEKTAGLIEFQKSRSSTKDAISFTVNVAVFSSTISEFFGKSLFKTLRVYESQWHTRLGKLSGSREDKWWELDADTNQVVLANEILELIIGFAIPKLEYLSNEEALLTIWKEGQRGGLHEIDYFRNLAILSRKFNDEEAFAHTMREYLGWADTPTLERDARIFFDNVALWREKLD